MRDRKYTGVWVFQRNLVYVRGALSVLDRANEDHTFILRHMDGIWGFYPVPAVVSSHCVLPESDRTILAITLDGSVHKATPRGFAWEHVDQSPFGPNSLRNMTCMRPIGRSVYAAGMARMVYRRWPGGHWERFDHGMRKSDAESDVNGFLAIDGCDEENIYCVGFKGEMWWFNGKKWSRIDSLTNLKLEQVRCVAPDLVYACGGSGVILQGAKSQWRVIEQIETTETFWGLEWYREAIWLADHSNIWRLTKDGALQRIDMGLNEAPTTRRLHAGDGVLWSVGDHDLIVFDGSLWTKLSPPEGAIQ